MSGIIIKCEKCKKTSRYRIDEMENIGTIWQQIWVTKCVYCGAEIKCILNFKENCKKPEDSNKKVISKKMSQLYAKKRVQNKDIREYWIQQYVKNNYEKIGFSKIEGPFEIGPDFKGIYKGKKVIIEVERDWNSYLSHGHDKDERFRNVDFLIVLNHDKPFGKVRRNLPKRIVYIDIDDFIKWWVPELERYTKKKKIQGFIDMISNEFHRRFIKNCTNKDKDLSTCPDCNSCAYFGKGEFFEAKIVFKKFTLKFIAFYKYPITSYTFELTNITANEIDKFYFNYFPQYYRSYCNKF